MRFVRGFTLIELSIVLVIIGLIVGGVLVGKDLIIASEVRSQIGQIEKYNTAVHTLGLNIMRCPAICWQRLPHRLGFWRAARLPGRVMATG